MTAKLRSTGQEIHFEEETPVTPEKFRELRGSVKHNVDLEAIARRREEAAEKELNSRHDRFVAQFDYAYPDVTANPALLQRVLEKRKEVIENAARNREVVDWEKTLPAIGEEVRKLAGLPSSAQRDREAYFDEIKKARGQE